jgi:hypothetical protein
VSRYARREPTAFFGAAVVAGFALSRFLRAHPDDGASASRSDHRRADFSGSDIGSRSGAQAAHRSNYTSGSAL